MLRILTKIFIFAFAFALAFAFAYSCQEGAKEKRQKLHSAFVYCLWLRFRLRWGDFDFRFCYFLICYCYCYWVIIFIHYCFTVCVCVYVCAQQNYLQKMIVSVHALSLGFVGLFFGYFRPTIWQVSRTQEEKRKRGRERRRSTNKKTAQEQCRSAQFDSLFALWLLIKSLSRYAQFLTASSPNFTISHPSNWLC